MKLTLLLLYLPILAFGGWGITETESHSIMITGLNQNVLPGFTVPTAPKFTALVVIKFKDASEVDRSGRFEYRLRLQWKTKSGKILEQTRTANHGYHGDLMQSFIAEDIDEPLGVELIKVKIETLEIQ